jgi:hypothetical protein
MTETARPRSTSRILHECARQVGFNAADGWPSELTLWELALVLSDVANDVETWQSVIAATPPPTITRQLPRHEEEKRLNRACRPEQHGYRLAFWEELVSVKLVEREAVAAWLRTIGETSETLNPCALAWLGENRAPESAGSETASKPDAKKDTIRAILTAIKKLDPEFSPEAMPGQKADFFALCREYDPQAFKTVAQSTFNDYLKGLCQFRPGARPTDYYREIAPRIGVKRIKAD